VRAATKLTGYETSAAVDSSAASKESGEPAHAGDSGGRSVWWRWKAPNSGRVNVEVEATGFEPRLAVYSGSSVASLAGVASEAASGSTGAVGFEAVKGVTYLIALDGANGLGGPSTLTLVLEPTVLLQMKDRSAREEGAGSPGAATSFTLIRKGSLTEPLSVFVDVEGSVDASDYQPLSLPIVIPAGTASVVVALDPIDDAIAEEPETLSVRLRSDDDYRVDAKKNQGSATVIDNEPWISVSAADAKAAEGEGDAGRFMITRKGSTTTALEVFYETGGSVGEGDVAPLSGSVIIPAGQASEVIDVLGEPDTEIETSESLLLTLLEDPSYRVNSRRSAATIMIANAPSMNVSEALGLDADHPVRVFTEGRGRAKADTFVSVEGNGLSRLDFEYRDVAQHISMPDYETFRWQSTSDGFFLRSHETEIGWSSITTTFNDLRIAPAILAGQSTDSSSIRFEVRDQSVDGTATVHTSVGEVVSVNTPAGAFQAMPITIDIDMEMQGMIDTIEGSRMLRASGQQRFVFYAAPGIGIVKLSTSASTTVSVQGLQPPTTSRVAFDLLLTDEVPPVDPWL
jgi:hypothetical protein